MIVIKLVIRYKGMNFSKASRQSTVNPHNSIAAESDFQKLIDICNSYGLNQEETDQLIEEFKRGALFSHDNSLNDSLNDSLSELTFSHK